MSTIQVQIAPDVEFKLRIEIPGIEIDSRDYDLQQHKAEVYAEFEKRLKKAFPEGIRIDTFEFGLDDDLRKKSWTRKKEIKGAWSWALQ